MGYMCANMKWGVKETPPRRGGGEGVYSYINAHLHTHNIVTNLMIKFTPFQKVVLLVVPFFLKVKTTKFCNYDV
jgi:hypothetical protein